MSRGGERPLIRLVVRVPAADGEAVLGALLEIAPGGLEQHDGDDWVEYALYGAAAELPRLPDGRGEIAGVTVEVARERVPGDWSERWKAFHRPALIGERLYLRPPWEPPLARDVIDLVIDPGQAFGTGTHPTTRLCLELMLDLPGRGAFADLGCGSGVLAIAAAKLGFSPVIALDADRAAIEATRANARANAVALDRLERVDLRGTPAPRADVVVANLMRPLLGQMARRAAARPPTLIASGLLEHEIDEVVNAFAPMVEHERRCERGWGAVALRG